jgi:hypothetical protein
MQHHLPQDYAWFSLSLTKNITRVSELQNQQINNDHLYKNPSVSLDRKANIANQIYECTSLKFINIEYAEDKYKNALQYRPE